MPRITREQLAQNRNALLEASGRLFRQRGIDGVGINDLCEAAGFTTGALYSQFGSKDALAAAAFQHGQQASDARRENAVGTIPLVTDVLDFYMSEQHRDNYADCCPLLASSSEAARQSAAFRASYEDAFMHLSKAIGVGLDDRKKSADDATSMVLAACMIGVVSAARALAGPDPITSNKLLQQARDLLGCLAKR